MATTGARDGHVAGVGRQAAHERAVDLQRLSGEALQVGQRRIAGAEVVDRHLHAQAAAAPAPASERLGSAISRLSVTSTSSICGSSAVAARASRSRAPARRWQLATCRQVDRARRRV
jgi:hypothetical protein